MAFIYSLEGPPRLGEGGGGMGYGGLGKGWVVEIDTYRTYVSIFRPFPSSSTSSPLVRVSYITLPLSLSSPPSSARTEPPIHQPLTSPFTPLSTPTTPTPSPAPPLQLLYLYSRTADGTPFACSSLRGRVEWEFGFPMIRTRRKEERRTGSGCSGQTFQRRSFLVEVEKRKRGWA